VFEVNVESGNGFKLFFSNTKNKLNNENEIFKKNINITNFLKKTQLDKYVNNKLTKAIKINVM
jgi:hypothetical protein